MDHTNEFLKLLDSILECCENLEALGRAIKDSLQETAGDGKADTSATPARLPETMPAKTYTFAEVRKACSAKSHAGYTEQIRELLSRYGAGRLSEVREEDYTALMAEVEVIG